jgi:hypothetical protein
MKNYILLANAVILVAALFAGFTSFTSPAEIRVSQPETVLDYQQQGTFDYTVLARPSSFYASQPLQTPAESPQIPLKFIERLDFNYSFQAGNAGKANIRIDAILEQPKLWQKTYNLVPEKALAGNSGISFSLDLAGFLNLAATIEKEMGVTTSSHVLSLQTIVSNRISSTGSALPDFIQTLPLQISGNILKIADDLAQSDSEGTGTFGYQVKLNENSLFGPVTITSPPPVNSPSLVLGPQDTVFTRFIDSMKMNYSYSLTSVKAITRAQENVNVVAILENPDRWTKTYVLLPDTLMSGDFQTTFPLDIQQYLNVFDSVQQETGVSAIMQNLTIQATVNLQAQTGAGPIEKTFSQTLRANLRDGILTWNDSLTKTEPGSIMVDKMVVKQAPMLGMTVFWWRIISVLLAIAGLLLFGYYLQTFMVQKRKISKQDLEIQKLIQKYKGMVVEVSDWPELQPGRTILPMNSLHELIKVSQGLLKPVNHKSEGRKHIFWINDELNRYEFLLSDSMNLEEIRARVAERLTGSDAAQVKKTPPD